MAYPASIPTKPSYKQRWDGWADSIDAAVRELIVDVPPMKTQVTQATTRVSQAESAITGLQSQQATTSSTASTALSTAQSAATSAGAAQQSAQTAQAAASQAATDAAASASQVSGLSSTVSGHTTQIGALESGKATTSALATVAFTGKYVDLVGAPVTAGGTATVLASTNFTGVANGSAWPPPWTAGQTPPGGSVTVQSERGQLVTGNTVGNYDSTAGASARYGTQIADFDVVYTLRRVSAGVHTRLVLRSDNGSLNPQNGVTVYTDGNYLSISQVASWQYTELAATSKTWTVGTDYKVRVQAVGALVQAKAWPAADTEPSTWDLTGNTTRTSAGWLGFWAGTDSAAASVTATYDDITLTDRTAPTGGAETVTADLTTVYNTAKA